MTYSPPRREDAASPKRMRPGTGDTGATSTFGYQQDTAKPACDQALHGAPDRHLRALGAMARAWGRLRRGDGTPGEIAADLALDLRANLGPAERALASGGHVLSLDPGTALRLGAAIDDEHGMASGAEIERRRQEMVERWKRGAP